MVTLLNKVLVAASAAMIVSGCASGGAVSKPVSYSQTAKANYKKGLEELKDENYLEGLKYFSFVKNKFPFSRFSTLSELRIADTYFQQEKYTAAIDAYKLFIKFHPTHPEVVNGYTAYRVCAGYVKQMPSDWFLVPPSHEKDQSATREAVSELLVFMRTYPRSKYMKKVKKLHRDTIRRLIEHELYVARFYLKRDKPKATILRLEGVLKRFPGAGVYPEVMLLLGKTYLKLDKRKKARATFASLVKKYPRDTHAAKALLYLRYLDAR
jgi:outer membrane protein assembly factor BamD